MDRAVRHEYRVPHPTMGAGMLGLERFRPRRHADDPDKVLELRIHGIKNTPPAEMLEREVDDITRDRGDDLGGFWRERASAAPDGVRREAYSWGALARSDGGALAGIGQLVVHVGWFLLLPFGLVNVAYWTRRIPDQGDPHVWEGGHGSGYVRAFGLGLTLLYVMALGTVSIELVGVQCYRASGLCAGLPEQFAALVGIPRATRLAIFAAVPLASVLVLYLLSARARARYEASVALMTAAQTSGLSWPVLATRGFWSRSRVTGGIERLHVAATAFLLAAMLAWDQLFSNFPQCDTPERFFSPDCLSTGPLASKPWTTACLVVAALGLSLVVLLVVPGTPGRGLLARRRSSLWMLVGSLVVLLGTAVATSIAGREIAAVSSPFLGLVSTPGNLIGILLVLAIAALGWRRGVPPVLTATLVGIVIAVPFSRYFLVDVFPFGAEEPWVYVAAAGVAIAVQFAVTVVPRHTHRRPLEGWSGAGPGVVLLLALGIAMALSTVLVVGIAAWLSRPNASGIPSPALEVPGVWADFALWFLVIVVLFVVGVAVVFARHLVGYPGMTTPTVDEIPGYERYALASYSSGGPARIPVVEPPPPRVLVARRTAGILHRAEPVLGTLAAFFGVALALTAAPDLKKIFAGGLGAAVNSIVEQAPDVALVVLAAIAAAAFTAVAANALTTKERPIGLLWDLICFLPRAGHPFGPPCYSERVVPEVNRRIREWMSPAGSSPKRYVILSAHSLGAVLATACIFALRGQGDVPMDRVGLITYGVQLRPYFGRFFPELFGAEVMGTRPCAGPSLTASDPWLAQVREDEQAPAARPRTDSLADILRSGGSDPAWVNLWRRTDFLGFPAASYREGNGVDRGASELDLRTYLPTIATHGHYPLTPQYQAALCEVLRRLSVAASPKVPRGRPGRER